MRVFSRIKLNNKYKKPKTKFSFGFFVLKKYYFSKALISHFKIEFFFYFPQLKIIQKFLKNSLGEISNVSKI
jgi:hypothetical protein